MSKNKLWKAEKQEDLAFYGEGERIKFLIGNTINRIAVVLCLSNSKFEDVISLTMYAELKEKEKKALEDFYCESANQAGCVVVNALTANTIENLIKQLCDNQSDGAIFLIKIMQGLLTSFEIRFGMTSAAAVAHKIHLRRAWKEQKRYREEIRGLRNELYGLQMTMKARVAAKKRLIRQQENEIVELRRTCKEHINKLCVDSESRMEKSCATSQEHQEELERELVMARNTLENLQLEHQDDEKKLRERKKQSEDILEQTIALYDDTMFKLHDEINGTEAGYLNEFQQLQALQIRFETQEVVYQAAMEEKHREEREELERQMQILCRRMAATRIQKVWRTYQIRKQERAKGKKGKKGRKKK